MAEPTRAFHEAMGLGFLHGKALVTETKVAALASCAYLRLPMRVAFGCSGQAKAWNGAWVPSQITLPIG